MKPRWLVTSPFLAAALLTIGCQLEQDTAAESSLTRVAAKAAAPGPAIADIPAAELRSVLADLARAHEQKTQLAWYVSTPLRSIDAPFKPFYAKMGQQEKDLLASLQAWAKAHNVDLTYKASGDTTGRAQKIMEDRQEKLVRGDDKTNFERDNLMQMYSDYEWQVAEVQALLPKIKDPALKTYLEKSLKIHEDGSAEILGLLKKYKFSA